MPGMPDNNDLLCVKGYVEPDLPLRCHLMLHQGSNHTLGARAQHIGVLLWMVNGIAQSALH